MDLPEIRQPHPLARRVAGEPEPQPDQVLTPVEVAVDQMLRAMRRTARDRVEVGQVVGPDRQRGDDRRREANTDQPLGKPRRSRLPIVAAQGASFPAEMNR